MCRGACGGRWLSEDRILEVEEELDTRELGARKISTT